MPPTTLSLPCSTAALRIGVAELQLGDVVDHVLPDGVVKRIAALLRYRLHRRRDRRDQRGHVSRQVVLSLSDLIVALDRAAAVVTQHQDQRRAEHGDGIFQAGDRFIVGEVAGHAANEEIAAAAIEGIFGRDARIGAAQDGGVRVLAAGQRLPLMLEVVPQRHALDIARISFQQAFSEASGDSTFCGFGGAFVSLAPAAFANNSPIVEAATPSTLRREGRELCESHFGGTSRTWEAPSTPLQRLHVDHARHRLDRAGDLRRDLEAARQLHLHLGFEVEHHHQRHVAVGAARGRLA